MREKTSEVIRFIISGIICFGVEFILLVLLKSGLYIDTLIATPIAFLVSVAINYWLCVKWVFRQEKREGRKKKFLFFFTSVMGLILNEIFMYLFRIILGEDIKLFTVFGFAINMYMVNKLFATLLVMIWNYFSKKHVLQS